MDIAILYLLLASLFALALFFVRRARSRVSKLDGVSTAQAEVLRRQLTAVGLALVLVFPMAFAPLVGEQYRNQVFVPYAVLSLLPLVYFSVSSIRHQVSLGLSKPFRGVVAIVTGLSTLLVALLGVALLIYFRLRY